MVNFSHAIIRYKKTILLVFLCVALLSALISLNVSVNYDMVDYLPKDAQSTSAIKIMQEEFGGETANARVMLTNVSIQEALQYKQKISEIEGVTSVSWLDNIVGLDTLQTTPLEFLDSSIVKNYYKDKNALLTLSIESGKESVAVNAIYELIGENNAAAGDAVNAAETQAMSVSEVMNAMFILLPIIIIILIISTTSWIEPLLFLFTIGIAIVINMGTNIIFGEISFITQTVSPILQLAVSLDYAIFLLHSFRHHRMSHEPQQAMLFAIKESIPTVAASAATTVVGFAALIFMRFGIGADLGINLLKGIILSFISVMVFLPALTMISYKAIDKTSHRKLIPEFKKPGNLLIKVRIPFLVLALFVVIPSFLAQSQTEFIYGMSSITSASRVGKDTAFIEEKFGKENVLVILVPKENAGKQSEFCNVLSEIPHVTSVVSFVTAVGSEVPPEFVPKEVVKEFYSENYARIILYTDTAEEGETTFDLVQTVLDKAAMHYDTYFLAGQSTTLFDMKSIVSTDTKVTNLVAILGIVLVLLVTFRSTILPLLLLFTIETAIWINLSFPYFTDKPLSFIGYLIISTVQLGATVDYAILLTNAYMNNRKILSKKDAMQTTLTNNLAAILTSAVILASAGFTLAFTTSNPIISELGTLLGRGTLLSVTMVACVLPALLILLDKFFRKKQTQYNKELKLLGE
ncbi:MMPL family transporter [Ruminiclostridium herbifermentans]|uniref:MMPL family transporter n=1 Tax=Ruminiclostridium herbifermentans TaxID=2488810 RepID=A0A4V6YE26_9FIRM|nr:MMPL family transporter [Ruminiclostridium herbifermentans]QNU68129.1 MMPL family transporter [Ruminiclostridium herbifermentans]